MTITYIGRDIEATLSWARSLMNARAALRASKPRSKEHKQAKWAMEHAWLRLTYWAGGET